MQGPSWSKTEGNGCRGTVLDGTTVRVGVEIKGSVLIRRLRPDINRRRRSMSDKNDTSIVPRLGLAPDPPSTLPSLLRPAALRGYGLLLN